VPWQNKSKHGGLNKKKKGVDIISSRQSWACLSGVNQESFTAGGVVGELLAL
jgi:hypothetical protein